MTTSRDGPAAGLTVGLFVFNRPSLTAQVLTAIADAQPERVLVVGDGPRDDHPEDKRLVAAVRSAVSDIDWPCEVSTYYADVNLGCGRRIASGLGWIFEQAGEAVILEDDCLPHPSFFRYCGELLRRYRNDDRVHMLAGANVLGETRMCGPYSYHFSRCYSIWGWATWARAWRGYDFEMRDWPKLRTESWLKHRVPTRQAERIVRQLLDDTYADPSQGWDFGWTLAGWRRDAVCAVPVVNLVTNTGHGDSATHLRWKDHPFASVPRNEIQFPLKHPPDVAACEAADREIWARLYPEFAGYVRGSIGQRLLRAAQGVSKRAFARRV